MRLRALVTFLSTVVSIPLSATPPSHCTADEAVVWSCATKQKVYSLCSSAAFAATSGYLQYRAGPPNAPTFLFPAQLEPPKGRFTGTLLARAVRISFSNDGHLYEVFDPLIGEASIAVSKGKRRIALIECSESTHTLTGNDVLEQLATAGGNK